MAAGMGLTLEGMLEVGFDWAWWGSTALTGAALGSLALLSSDQHPLRGTCATAYPSYNQCEELVAEEYIYESVSAAVGANFRAGCRATSPKENKGGPCPLEWGHYRVRCPGDGSEYSGSIMCCTCCDDVPGTGSPVLRYRCRTT